MFPGARPEFLGCLDDVKDYPRGQYWGGFKQAVSWFWIWARDATYTARESETGLGEEPRKVQKVTSEVYQSQCEGSGGTIGLKHGCGRARKKPNDRTAQKEEEKRP